MQKYFAGELRPDQLESWKAEDGIFYLVTEVDDLISSLQEETTRLYKKTVEQAEEIKRLKWALNELHVTVKGECPSLLNEDSGGNAELDMKIEAAIKEPEVKG